MIVMILDSMKRVFLIMVSMIAVFAAVSCDKYEDGKPSKNIRNEFDRLYPKAFDIEWEWDGKYWEVSFETGSRPNGTEHEAWFDGDANWLKTVTEVFITSVPERIIGFLTADPTYGTAPYADNDAEYIQTPSGDFYRFDLRVEGRVVEVDVNDDGEVKFADYDF